MIEVAAGGELGELEVVDGGFGESVEGAGLG